MSVYKFKHTNFAGKSKNKKFKSPKKMPNYYNYRTVKGIITVSVGDDNVNEYWIKQLYELQDEENKNNRRKEDNNDVSLEALLENNSEIEVNVKLSNLKHSHVEMDTVRNELYEKLYYSINALSNKEAYLIKRMFFHDVTERELAYEFNISQKNINKLKQKTLKKLRNEITKH